MPTGKVLRLELADNAIVHWSADSWATSTDTNTTASGLGTHFADLPVQELAAGGTVVFTFYWRDAGVWENEDFTVRLGE